MFPMKPALLLLGALALGAVVPAAPALAQHDHAAHGRTAAPQPPPQSRWVADAALQDGMGRIDAALEELRHYEMGHMDATMALDRVGLIQRAAADIFAKCRLAPERDAVLHGMLMPLLAAARQLQADPRDVAQVQAMRQAVAGYPRYFAAPASLAH